MKKSILTTVLLTSSFFFLAVGNQACSTLDWFKSDEPYKVTALVGTPLDYSQKSNWMFLNPYPRHEVDLFYVYPTVIDNSRNNEKVSLPNKAEKKDLYKYYRLSTSAFSSYTNVYAPFYRQIPMDIAVTLKPDDFEKYAMESSLRTDIYAALDTFFTKHNQGRPFILAGHSQGAMIIKFILSDYMKAHPEYLKRMVAAYAVGYGVTKDWLEENKHVKFAEGETDTGVVISWNTGGPDPQIESQVVLPGAISINPINWKRDETLATVKENKGTINKKTEKIGKGIADAKVNLKRGVVVCSTSKNYVPLSVGNKFYGDKSFHYDDYSFYYVNVKENGLKRVKAYLANHKK